MYNSLASAWFRLLGGTPCFQIYGKGCRESDWRVINVYATSRRDASSRWPAPFWRGTLITWSSTVISLGRDCAKLILSEQIDEPASRERPVFIPGGRVNPVLHSSEASRCFSTASEILAHECGHTAQARRLGFLYLIVGASFTLWREGVGFLHWFENQASEEGRLGGIVAGSVDARLWNQVCPPNSR